LEKEIPQGGHAVPKIIHFEINADDPGRAIKFYSDVFGWSIDLWTGPAEYWLISTGQGINGGIMRRMDAAATTVNTIQVDSIDKFLKKVVRGGGHIITPKAEIPGIGFHAYCRDTEGNIFGLIEQDGPARITLESEGP
jgi:predicted enzyme related to lactoylglutathione lyase